MNLWTSVLDLSVDQHITVHSSYFLRSINGNKRIQFHYGPIILSLSFMLNQNLITSIDHTESVNKSCCVETAVSSPMM